MAYSAGSSVTCPQLEYQPFQQLSFSKVVEPQRFALPSYPNSQMKRRRRQTAHWVASARGSPSCNDEVCSDEKKRWLNRRALVALVGVFTHTAFLCRSRADEKPANESEQIRQEMIRKIEKRLKSSPTNVVDTTSTLGSSIGSGNTIKSAPTDVETSSAFGSAIKPLTAVSEPVTDNNNLLIAVAAEALPQQEESGGSVLGSLNTLGVIGSGVLGGFYWLERRAKAASDSVMKDLASKLKAREDAMLALKEQLEGKILAEKEQASKQSRQAQEERKILSDELASAKLLAKNLDKELETEKSFVWKFEKQVESLQAAVKDAGKHNATLEEKLSKEQHKGQRLEDELKTLNSQIQAKGMEIDNLHSELQEKEDVSANLSCQLSEATEALLQAKHRVLELEKEMSTINVNLSQSETAVHDLKGKLATAITHGEETHKQLTIAHQELDSLKLSSVKELKVVQSTLASKEAEVQQLTLKLVDASKEAEKSKEIIGDLQFEINALKQQVIEENAAIKRLTGELNASSQKLETAQAQVDSLSQELQASRELKEQLDKKVLDVQKEADANLSSLQQALAHEQALSSQLNRELKMVKEDLDSSRREASSLFQQFKEFEASYNQLKKDFLDSEAAVKATTAALNKERELAATNKKQLESARRAIAEAKENIKLLREDVEKAKTELKNVNKEVIELGKELEVANAKVATLEIEKASLNESLHEERKLSSNLKQKVNQVDVALAKLSKEKETTTKRAKKLEGELASSKGEMLRLKKQITTMDTAVEEAKSRVQSIAESTHLQEQSTNAAEISSEMENIQAELSYLQKSLEDAGRRQAEAEAAVGSLQDVMQNRVAEDAVLVSPVSRREGEA